MARQNFSRELEFGKKLKKTISISIFTDIKTIFKKQMKIKEIKGSSLRNLNKIYKPLAILTKIKRYKSPIRNETGNIITDPSAIKMIVREYCKIYTHKSDNVEEMDHFSKPTKYQNSAKMRKINLEVLKPLKKLNLQIPRPR